MILKVVPGYPAVCTQQDLVSKIIVLNSGNTEEHFEYCI